MCARVRLSVRPSRSVNQCLCPRRRPERGPADLLLSALPEAAAASRRSEPEAQTQRATNVFNLVNTASPLLPGAPNDDVIIVLQCLDAMLTRRKKQVTLQRVMAFIKRLSMLSVHTLPNASVGLLSTTRDVLHVRE